MWEKERQRQGQAQKQGQARKRQRKEQGQGEGSNIRHVECGVSEKGHTRKDCPKLSAWIAEKKTVGHEQSANSIEENAWIFALDQEHEERCEPIMIDSGASVHMCPPDHGQEYGLRKSSKTRPLLTASRAENETAQNETSELWHRSWKDHEGLPSVGRETANLVVGILDGFSMRCWLDLWQQKQEKDKHEQTDNKRWSTHHGWHEDGMSALLVLGHAVWYAHPIVCRSAWENDESGVSVYTPVGYSGSPSTVNESNGHKKKITEKNLCAHFQFHSDLSHHDVLEEGCHLLYWFGEMGFNLFAWLAV